MSMRALKVTGIGFALALGALAAMPAAAAQVYDWTFTNTLTGIVEGQGTLTTGAADGGGFDVTALTGSLDDPTIGVNAAISSFTPGSGNDGVFQWDNVVYTNSTPHLDNGGLLFDVGNQEINIYNLGGGFPNGDIAAGSSNNYGGDQGTFNISAVPEPASWAMVLLGVGLIGGGLRVARRNDDMARAAA
jgi:hypothetical protein